MIPPAVRRTAEDIRKLKIQGATNVAVCGLRSLETLGNPSEKTLRECAALLAKMRPTEPLLRNGLAYVLHGVRLGMTVKDAADDYIGFCNVAFKKIVEVGAKRIENNAKIMTHCHSSLVTHILSYAKKTHGKRFEVFASEARPLFQGRLTAAELAKAGIPVTFYVDSAMNSFVNKADFVLVGCDAITADGDFLNKIGTSALAFCADEAETKFVVATELLKFDPKTTIGNIEKIEERCPCEVWKNPPKRVRVRNPAFDITPAKYIHSLITEAGVILPQGVPAEVKAKYPWIL